METHERVAFDVLASAVVPPSKRVGLDVLVSAINKTKPNLITIGIYFVHVLLSSFSVFTVVFCLFLKRKITPQRRQSQFNNCSFINLCNRRSTSVHAGNFLVYGKV